MQSSSNLEHSSQPQNSRGAMLMYEELFFVCSPCCISYNVHQIVTSLCFCNHFSKMGFVGERAVKRDSNIPRPVVVVFQPFPIYNYVRLLVISSIVQVESDRHSFGHTRCSHQRLQNYLILAMSVLMVVLRSSNLRA